MPPITTQSLRPTAAQKLTLSHKSLTPKRKHRKMLKDGSSEVWPEAVESLFVEGLKAYWESPWASFSRGRSRWRNAYLVEYLQKAGITRTKKQVASHIQVLRNMWKGEPEFQLVAGADDVNSESDSVGGTGKNGSVSGEDSDVGCPQSPPTATTAVSVTDDYVAYKPMSSSSSLRHVSIASDSAPHLPPSLHIKTEELNSLPSSMANSSPLEYTRSLSSPASSTSPSSFSFLPSRSPSAMVTTGLPYTSDMIPRTSGSPHQATSVKSEPSSIDHSHLLNSYSSSIETPYSRSAAAAATPGNRVTSLTIWSDGMVPLSIDVDALSATAPRAPASLPAFRVRLTIPAPEDMSCPSALHGFSAAVSLTAPWSSSGQCSTKVYVSGVCTSEEFAELVRPSAAGSPGLVVPACLPDSWLGRCRWLESNAQTTICQKVVVDGEVLLVIVYELDRSRSSSGASGPAAELTGFKCVPSTSKSSPLPSPISGPSSTYVTPRDYQVAATAPLGVPSTRQCAYNVMNTSSAHGFSHFSPSSVPFC